MKVFKGNPGEMAVSHYVSRYFLICFQIKVNTLNTLECAGFPTGVENMPPPQSSIFPGGLEAWRAPKKKENILYGTIKHACYFAAKSGTLSQLK